MAVLAVVRSYYLCGDAFYVVAEAGQRTTYYPSKLSPVPGCFGLMAADMTVLEVGAG
jgi:hypothetical protein